MNDHSERLAQLQKEIAEKQKEVLALLKTKNETDIANQTLLDQSGKSVTISELMGDPI